jgi:hypothetical protein
MNTIQLRPDVVDFGNAPEVLVTGYRSISRVSAGIIRETFYSEQETDDGRIERRVVLSIIWDAEQWFSARRVVATAVDPKHIPPVPAQGETEYGLATTH